MTYLPILCATLAVASAQMHQQALGASSREPETVIQNKNVNIIVNMDPREVATELWKVIEAHLNNRSSHLVNSQNTIMDLERLVAPIVSTARRGATQPSSAYQVASELDRITRRALTRNAPDMDTIDEEIMARDIVAELMVTLKMLFARAVQSGLDEEDALSRRMHVPAPANGAEDDYVDVRIKIRRRDIVGALH